MSYHNTLYTLDLSGTGIEHNVAQIGQWIHMYGPTCQILQWDRTDVGYGALKERQWTPMDSPVCPMVLSQGT